MSSSPSQQGNSYGTSMRMVPTQADCYIGYTSVQLGCLTLIYTSGGGRCARGDGLAHSCLPQKTKFMRQHLLHILNLA